MPKGGARKPSDPSPLRSVAPSVPSLPSVKAPVAPRPASGAAPSADKAKDRLEAPAEQETSFGMAPEQAPPSSAPLLSVRQDVGASGGVEVTRMRRSGLWAVLLFFLVTIAVALWFAYRLGAQQAPEPKSPPRPGVERSVPSEAPR